MSLSEFKFIYFWEYVHRLLGRVIGLAFALPLLWFAIKRAIPKGYGKRLVFLAECLGEHFDTDHCTFQLEPVGHGANEVATHR